MRRAGLWVAFAVLLSFRAFARSIPLAAWVAPVLGLWLVRTSPRRGRFVLAAIAHAAADLAMTAGGVVLLPLPARLALAVTAGLVWTLPYLLDSLAGASRLRPLVFPAAVAALDTLASQGPFGTWGSTAYTHAANLPLVQVAAMTGLAGIVFLTHWPATGIVDALLERRLTPSLRACAVVLAVVHAAGSARLMLDDTAGRSVAVGAVAPSQARYEAAYRGWTARALATADAETRAAHHPHIQMLGSDVVSQAAALVGAGADLVVGPEGIPVLEEDLPALEALAAQAAAPEGAVVIGAWVVRRTRAFPWVDNTAILVGRDGVAGRFSKRHPVPGLEDTKMRPGTAREPLVLPTAGARVALLICFDADFPAFVRAAARAGAEMLVVPADDWPAIAELHSRMATLRAVETGLPLVRPASNGTTLVVDARGRTLARADGLAHGAAVLVPVPVTTARVAYPWIGDTFGAACGLLVAATFLPRRRVAATAAPRAA